MSRHVYITPDLALILDTILFVSSTRVVIHGSLDFWHGFEISDDVSELMAGPVNDMAAMQMR